MLPDGPILTWALDAGFVLLVAAMALAFLRLARGPSLPDRVVALDLITILAVAFSALFAIASGEAAFLDVAIASDEAAFLDVAIALALVAFLATVALARFAERRKARSGGRRDDGGAEP